MNTWKLPDGRTLVEGELRELAREFDAPGVGRVRDGHAYHLLSADGRLEYTYLGGPGAVQEHSYDSVYRVVGPELLHLFADWSDDSPEGRPSVHVTVGLAGLSASALAECPGAGNLPRLLAEREALAARNLGDAERRDEERLAGFERSLPEYPGEKNLVFVWQYAADREVPLPCPVVVRRKDGPVVWTDRTWAGLGRDLHAKLHAVLKSRYGRRLKAFEVDCPGTSCLMFNPD